MGRRGECLTRRERVGCIPEEDELPLGPGRELLHVEELPDFDCGGVGLGDEGFEARVEVGKNFEDLVEGGVFVPFWAYELVS